MTTLCQLNFKIIISKFKHNKYKTSLKHKLCSQTSILEIGKAIKKIQKSFLCSTFGLIINTN